MPVRSITVRLVVPRKKDELQAARDLWLTHEKINEATAFYEMVLLEMRGEAYLAENGELVASEDVHHRLKERVDLARVRNGKKNLLHLEKMADIFKMLRQLYEAIVPSSVGAKGDAQQANAFLGPLTDPNSKGFLAVFDKVGSPPSWLEGVRTGEQAALTAAQDWSLTPEGKARLQATGSPPTWVRKYRKNEEDWPLSFVADYDKKLGEAGGVPSIIKALKDEGVLPLFDPFLTSRISEARSTLSPWDRLAFRLSVAHMLSWESWGRRTADDYRKRVEQVEKFRQTYLSRPETVAALDTLRQYEADRKKEITAISFAPTGSFRIRQSMVRSWPDLREQWIKSKDQCQERLISLSADAQTRLRGNFGDPHLFSWLAKPENHHVWKTNSDVVSLYARHNALQSRVERTRIHATMTLPDACRHPRSVQWEPQGGSNLKNYKLSIADGRLRASLPLLREKDNGTFHEIYHTFEVAATSQFQKIYLEAEKKGVSLSYENQTGEVFTGKLNSSDLLLDWDYLRFRKLANLKNGQIGSAYLKIVLDIDQIIPQGLDGKRPKALNHFTSAIGNDKHADGVSPGLRILSIDLGTRSFATCSVFELKNATPQTAKFYFPVNNGMWAVHERSFVLRLPDEQVDAKGKVWQKQAVEELRALRRTLGRYRGLYRLKSTDDPTQRGEILSDLLTAASENGWPFEVTKLSALIPLSSLPAPNWQQHVSGVIEDYRHKFGKIVSEWRRRTRGQTPYKFHGKSMWAIDHLTNVRRFLVSWSMLGRDSGDIHRLDRKRRGVFAARLLNHLEGMKNDRLKTGADLIVQAARGFLRDKAGYWHKKFAPCHAVLFEDLTRYRMKTDRPKRENSLLMKWAHRQIPAEVAMQGDVYGIYVCETGAAFSSRYHAASQSPGIRCHPMSATDFNNIGLRYAIELENPKIDWESLRPGTLVPLSGGEIFTCLNNNGGFTTIHADINAAQNLQRRFWTRHAESFRLPCRKIIINGTERWLPRTLGKRLQGSLGGFGWLIPTGHDSGSCRWEVLSPQSWKRYGGEVREEEGASEEVKGFSELEEEILEESGEVIVFFRDPSGVILPSNFWYPSKMFWGVVKKRTTDMLLNY